MVQPPADGPDPDRIPTQAELDAEDLAEIERQRAAAGGDEALLYPDHRADPGPPPQALATARLLWLGSAVAGLISVGYGFWNLGLIREVLAARLLEGLVADADPSMGDPVGRAESMADFFPPAMLVMIPVLLAIEYPLLRAVATHHSRNCRNMFIAAAVVNLLFIPIGIDLLFDYPEVSGVMPIIGWLQFALLLVAAIFTLRRAVERWLPPSTRIRPSRMLRPGR